MTDSFCYTTQHCRPTILQEQEFSKDRRYSTFYKSKNKQT